MEILSKIDRVIMNTINRIILFVLVALYMLFSLYIVSTVVSLDGNSIDWAMSFSGGISSCIAEFWTMPIETSKVRMQLSKGSVSMTGAFFDMVKNEGLFSTWNGVTAALCRQFLYQSIKMMIYEPIRNGLSSTFGTELDGSATLWQMVLAGGFAGLLGAMITSPFDMAKVRAQADSSLDRTKAQMEYVLVSIYRHGGAKALWTGWVPSAQRAFIINASELATYGYVKRNIMMYLGYGDNITTHFLASCVAGFVAAAASTPPDRLKILLMAADPGTYSGLVDCLIKTVRSQGVLGLYKGFVANWARMAPWNLMFFVVLEQMNQTLSSLSFLSDA